VGTRFSSPGRASPEAHPSFCTIGTGSLSLSLSLSSEHKAAGEGELYFYSPLSASSGLLRGDLYLYHFYLQFSHIALQLYMAAIDGHSEISVSLDIELCNSFFCLCLFVCV